MSTIETKTVQLPDSGQAVEIKAALSWYDLECIQSTISNGARYKIDNEDLKFDGFGADVLLAAKRVLFERGIVSIKDKDGNAVAFSQEWLENLTQQDGATLDLELDTLKKK